MRSRVESRVTEKSITLSLEMMDASVDMHLQGPGPEQRGDGASDSTDVPVVSYYFARGCS